MNESKKQLQDKTKKAMRAFFGRADVAVLATDYEADGRVVDFIIQDDDVIAFVTTSGKTAEGEVLFANSLSVEEFESVVCAYLVESPYVNIGVRMDCVTVIVVGEDRALLRWHKSAFDNEAK